MKFLSYHLLSSVLKKASPVVLGVVLSIFTFHIFPSTAFAQASTFQDQLITLVNQERTKNNLISYNKSDKLNASALNHNKVMAECALTHEFNSCFSHQVSLSKETTLLNRISSTGYNPQFVAENIAWGQTSAHQVVSSWMQSVGHRTNILSTKYKEIGCSLLDTANGKYNGMWWTCNFGASFVTKSASPTSMPTPKPSQSPMSSSLKPATSPISYNPLPEKPWWCRYIPTHTYCR